MAPARTSSVALVVGAAVVAYGWWVTGLEPFSLRATGFVLGAGMVAMVTGGRRTAMEPAVSLRAVAPWVVLAGVLAAWQLAAYTQHPRSDHPTLSSLANTALDPRPLRAAAFAAWLVTTAWLARR